MAEYEKVRHGWPESRPAIFLHSWLTQQADGEAVNIT